MADIRRMLDPKTIALIGASEREKSTGRDLLRNLLSTNGREGTIYPGRSPGDVRAGRAQRSRFFNRMDQGVNFSIVRFSKKPFE